MIDPATITRLSDALAGLDEEMITVLREIVAIPSDDSQLAEVGRSCFSAPLGRSDGLRPLLRPAASRAGADAGLKADARAQGPQLARDSSTVRRTAVRCGVTDAPKACANFEVSTMNGRSNW